MSDFNSTYMLDTIAAVSTPRGKGGVALIRISGPDALEIGKKIFRPRISSGIEDRPRYAVFGDIVMPKGSGTGTFREGDVIDDGLATFFRAPASFTGEDTVEICCHGGVLVTRTVLEAALSAGARQAEKGEFTRRAFAAGKMGLSEAEALGMLLEAGTDAQLKLSRSGISGTLSAACEELRRTLTMLITDIYARVDFPEEDLGSIPADEVRARLAEASVRAGELMRTYRTGRAVAEGITTVICGRTNAGKSTLYNRLVGSDEAIVTDVEGTTRDILTAVVSFGGATLKLYDTAGIRDTASDAVEIIGIERAKEKIACAELVFFLIDGTRQPDGDDEKMAEELRRHPGHVIALLTKADKAEDADPGAYALWESFPDRKRISAASGEGMDRLAERVGELFIDGELDLGSDPVISSARQYEALRKTVASLDEAISSMDDGFPPDVAGVCLEMAADHLSELDGRGHGAVSADVIDGIFAKFCVGK